MHTNVAFALGALELWINTPSSRFAEHLHFCITYTVIHA